MKYTSILILLTIATLFSCQEDETVAPITVNFLNQEVSIASAGDSATVDLVLSRAAENTGEMVLLIETGNLIYGADNDFYTNPPAENNEVILSINPGTDQLSFDIIGGEGLNIRDEATIQVSFSSFSEFFQKGENQLISVSFTENFIAQGGILELNAGGDAFDKKSFIDLSKQQVSTVNVLEWDLGFYNEEGSYFVKLNSPGYVMAYPLEKTDLSSVTAEDTIGLSRILQIPQFDPTTGASAFVDHPDGDLEKSVFGAISSDVSESRVHIIKRDGEGRNWKKVKITRNEGAYKIEYADIDDNNTQSAIITKASGYNFQFFDLDNGLQEIEPMATDWDLQYGTFTELFPFGGQGVTIPYGFKDFIVLNRNNVQAAMIMEDAIPFSSFSSVDIQSIAFESRIDAIGETWRSGGGPTSGPALNTDRYYIISDPEGNVYKLRFTRLTSPEGERGYPEIEYELIKS